MLTLLYKFLSVTALPLLFVIVWKKFSRAGWACVFAALAAVVISNTAMEITHNILADVAFWQIPLLSMTVYGLIREGTRWLVMRATPPFKNFWHDGVLFGLVYNFGAILASLAIEIAGPFFRTGSPESLLRIAVMEPWLNDRFRWIRIEFLAREQGLFNPVFNVATCLLVLYSVRQRKLWPFLLSIPLYILVSFTMDIVFAGYGFLVLHGIHMDYSISFMDAYYAMNFLTALPSLWIIFRFWKIRHV